MLQSFETVFHSQKYIEKSKCAAIIYHLQHMDKCILRILRRILQVLHDVIIRKRLNYIVHLEVKVKQNTVHVPIVSLHFLSKMKEES